MADSVKKLSFPNRLFLLLATLFGFLIIQIVPPLQAPDEGGHFVKAYAFSELQIQPQPQSEDVGEKDQSTWGKYGFKVPYAILSMRSYAVDKNGKKEEYPYNNKEDDEKIKNGERVFFGTGGITNYYFVNYLPQIMGISIGRVLGKPMVSQYYLARYCNLIAYILIVFFAILRFPFSKLGAAILALNPMSLFLAASVSGDAMIIAVSFFFISWIFGLTKQEHVSDATLLISGLLMVNLVLIKPNLIVLGLLFFTIPNKAFSIQRKAIWGFAILAACMLFYMLWNQLMIDQQILYHDYGNPSKQLAAFFKDPSIFFDNLRKNYLFGAEGDHILYSSVGKFGKLDTSLGLHWIILYFTSVVVACLVQDKGNHFLIARQKLIVVLTMAAYVVLTFFALYQIWNEVGRTSTIEGLQGRYFLPVGLLIAAPFSSKKKILNIQKGKMNMILSACILLVLIASMVVLATRYPSAA